MLRRHQRAPRPQAPEAQSSQTSALPLETPTAVRSGITLWPWGRGMLLIAVAAVLLHRSVHQQTPAANQLKDEPQARQQQQQLLLDLLSADPSPAFCSRKRPPHVCAHGGATSAAAPPNTRAAYAAALSAGFDCIEVDVALTADSQLVALHDRDLQQLLNSSTDPVKVHERTLAELQQLSWHTGESVLSAAEALAATAPHVGLLIIDVKTVPGNRVVMQRDSRSQVSEEAFMLEELLGLQQQHGYEHNTLMWGKSDEVARLVKRAAPKQLAGYTVMFSPGAEFEQPLRVQEAEVVAVYHGMLNTTLMETFRQANKTVIAWTPNSPSELHRMLDLAVDGCVTNEPYLLQRAVQAWTARCSIRDD